MGIIALTKLQIQECVKKLAQSAKAKISEFPKETWSIEHHYVSEHYERDGEELIFSLKCNPALKKEKMKNMMVCCVVCSPTKGCEFERPIMYEPVDTVIETINSEACITKMVKDFEVLFQEIEDFDPDEPDDFFPY